ncbi:hypothetical protein JB92DRAFT_2973261 [Gautieria morchelliformis]|nr:hypothetical protein JB92DRAFT_2973261 [Gautieria morchelliformis]
MSSQELIHRLAEPLRSLVLSVTKNADSTVFGTSEQDAADVVTWLEKASKADIVDQSSIKSLDAHLVSRTFLVSNYLTAADVAVYGALHPVICTAKPEQYYSHPSVTRYFDHIQTRPQVRSAAALPFALVSFDIESAPKPTRTVEPPKKKEKTLKVVADAAATAPKAKVTATEVAPSASDADGKKSGKKDKKEPKEKKNDRPVVESGGKKASGKSGGTANEPTAPVPSMIDLRVGHIIDVQKHPDADGLYVEQIDIGEETGPRTVVSGLVNYIPIEQMRDRPLIAVCNLKPANMRGVKSFAMVLCATHKDGKDAGIEIVDPPKHSKPGDRIYFEGPYENDQPLDQLNPKKKIFETIQPGFTTLETREAAWVDPVTKSVHRLRTHGGGDGVCLAPSFVGASLS